MKIYFEDEELRLNDFYNEVIYKTSESLIVYDINASCGVSACINSARYLLAQNKSNIIIYTNCLELFNNRYAWNDELKVPEIYIRHKDTREFVRIDTATERELKEGHNLARLYLAGEFSSVTNALDTPPIIN
ncbi:MAG: hypothetical protein IJZ36_02455 [Bacilli bacterium]|nr:hypothetical protein [Bacilli bacterium]